MNNSFTCALRTIVLTISPGYQRPEIPSQDGKSVEKDILPKLYVFVVESLVFGDRI
jgi:hypothetical protein